MKSTIFKLNAFILFFALMGAGCEKDDEDLSYLDNTKSFYPAMPGFAIYKTEKDYFFNVPTRPYGGSYQSPEIDEKSANIILFKGQYYKTNRYRLIDNYVVDEGIYLNYYFTSISYDEYIREKLSPLNGTTNPKVINSIVDRDPFSEFYYSKESFEGKTGLTIDEINQLIQEKNLEKYFTKLK